MATKEFIKRALDTSNAFLSTDANAITVNPLIWNRQLRDYEEMNLVVTNLADTIDFRSPGREYTVTIDVAPTAAADLVETVDVPISSFTTRQVTFNPTERGAAYQLTRKEAVRAFFDVAERMVKKLGYSLAVKKDALAISTVLTGATHAVVADDVDPTDIDETNTLGYTEVTQAIRKVEGSLYNPKYLIVNHFQKQQLLDLGTVNEANKFGTRSAIEKGLIGELFGLFIYQTTHLPVTGNRVKAIVLGESQSGDAALGYAIKRDPIIETEYHARGRFWDIVAHEEYDFQVFHPGAMCTIETFSA